MRRLGGEPIRKTICGDTQSYVRRSAKLCLAPWWRRCLSRTSAGALRALSRELGVELDLGMPKPSKPPKDLNPWLGVWIETRIDDEAYNRALEASGIPWPIRELLAKFTAQREFALPPGKPLLIRSKMITGACSDHTNS